MPLWLSIVDLRARTSIPWPITLELVLQTKDLRKLPPQLATLVMAEPHEGLRASATTREGWHNDVVQAFKEIYAPALTPGTVKRDVQRTAACSWSEARFGSDKEDRLLDRPFGRLVEVAKAGNAAFGISLLQYQLCSVFPRLSIDDNILVLDTETKR